jgi:ATP-binding cassette subfamily F protein 3
MAQGRLRRLIRMVKAVELGGVQILQQNWLRATEQVEISKTKWSVLETEGHIKALQSPHPRHHRLKMRLQNARRGGNIILRTKGLRVGYPGTDLFESEDIELLRRQVAALVGDNGTGKTTFLRTITGELEPLAGEVRVGASLDIGYFAQAQDALDSDKSVLDEFMWRSGMLVGPARDYLARYVFRGDDVYKPLGALSGGERSRLALAFLSLEKANFFLLDEPTNHLDIPSQEALEEALLHFQGTILMVSHDRYLVDKLATQVWDLRDGYLRVHKGGYQSYLAAREQERERAREAKERSEAEAKRATAPAKALAQGEDLGQAEALIEEAERSLHQLGEELVAATAAQQWERVRLLKREHEEAQSRLEALLQRWEALAAA